MSSSCQHRISYSLWILRREPIPVVERPAALSSFSLLPVAFLLLSLHSFSPFRQVPMSEMLMLLSVPVSRVDEDDESNPRS